MNNLVNSVMPGLADKMNANNKPMTTSDFIKNIDAKIAELEKEEREKSAKRAVSKKSPSEVKIEPVKKPVVIPKQDIVEVNPKVDNSSKKETKGDKTNTFSSIDFATKITEKVNKAVKETSNEESKKNNNVSQVKNENVSHESDDFVTDDQFFDDFFSDDE